MIEIGEQPGRSRHGVGNTRGARPIAERPVAVVVQEQSAGPAHHQDVQMAVIVVVADDRGRGRSERFDSRARGDRLEPAAIVSIDAKRA